MRIGPFVEQDEAIGEMTMACRFLNHYRIGKASEVLEEFTSAVVAFDPDTTSKAQIAMMQAELETLGKRVVEAKAEVKREHGETEELQRTYDRYLEAARVLERRLETANDTERRGELEGSLAKLIEQLERLKPELAREQEEDREADIWAGELRASFEDLAAKLHHAEGVRSARRPVETAKLQRQRAAERHRRSSAAARLTTALSTISVALDAMNKETARVRAESDALQLQAKVLQGDRLEHDPHIAAALNVASPRQLLDRRSLRDRLARLDDRPVLESASAA